ncbi:MAG: hypothetical protein ACKPKO_44400, partial [Candidatus Fonsibacter sp.]
MKSAVDVYEEFDGVNFDKYEHLGSVQQPAPKGDDQDIEASETYTSADQRFEDHFVADVLQHFGIDFNVVLDLSEDNHQALSVRLKKRDRSYTECIDVR